ncbi:helix-turn-helix domain-containing protein [Actinomadura hibisca]|uniref:helix-turn-helix domain-containing protein n=1 Tax=Actinomadura hibisca TaxID=68565 RepID=UPI00082EA307|nr:helix-turn-helix domain-containing protein [Actinomadura hibisca]
MSGAHTDPADPTLTTGQRIKFYRQRQGMSRAVLGELIGSNERWIKAVENGQIQHPKLTALIGIAEALRVRDLGQLTGGQAMPTTMFRGPGHPALPAVRDAINVVTVATDAEPSPLPHLQARLAAAWRARHAAPDHRTVLGGLLPDLIRDAKRAARAYEGAERRRALALLAETYNLCQFFVAYQPDAGLLWRVAERAIMAAEESEDPQAFGASLWLLAQAHRDAGDFDAAESVNRQGMDVLRPAVADAGDDLRAMWGALHFEAAYTAARTGQEGVAWRWWDQADTIARSLPRSHYDPMTSFSQAIMPAHAVTVAVELRKGGESARQARRASASAIPSRPRRGRHLIEVARAWQLSGDTSAELGALDNAYSTAPETIRYNSHARHMVFDLAERPGSLRRAANDLAGRVGLLV